MIPRYSRPQIEKIWSLENKFLLWLKIECLVAEKQSKDGLIPTEAAKDIIEKSSYNIKEIEIIEEETKEIITKAPLPPKKIPAKKKQSKNRGQSIPFDKNRFTIQISSKKVLSDAKKVAIELIDAGYDAYIQKALFVETNEIWYRIRVGSYDKKETAIAVAKSLSSNRREKAWVDYVRYER